MTNPQAAEAMEVRAGGTDLTERRRSGISTGEVHDIAPNPALTTIAWNGDGSARIGCLVTIDKIASDAKLALAYPGLSAAAAGLATPQVRRVGTIGGNLLQRTRCWYYRSPQTSCLKKGGDDCPARAGNHLYGVIFDRGPCVAPHPSTMAAALLAYEARVTTSLRTALAIDTIYGDGSDGRVDHLLAPGEMLNHVDLPPPLTGERATYQRTISRAHAEWPLVEVIARVSIKNGVIDFARVAVGGVAPVPMRLTQVERALTGATADTATCAAASKRAIEGATALPRTGYKLQLLQGSVLDALTKVVA